MYNLQFRYYEPNTTTKKGIGVKKTKTKKIKQKYDYRTLLKA